MAGCSQCSGSDKLFALHRILHTLMGRPECTREWIFFSHRQSNSHTHANRTAARISLYGCVCGPWRTHWTWYQLTVFILRCGGCSGALRFRSGGHHHQHRRCGRTVQCLHYSQHTHTRTAAQINAANVYRRQRMCGCETGGATQSIWPMCWWWCPRVFTVLDKIISNSCACLGRRPHTLEPPSNGCVHYTRLLRMCKWVSVCGLVVRVDSIKLCLDSPLDANICTTNEVTLLAQCWQRFFFF